MQKKIVSILVICTALFSYSFSEENQSSQLTKEEIFKVIDNKLGTTKTSKHDIKNYNNVKKQLAKKLKQFKVTGVATTVDPNIALIYDSQNPTFEMTFKNEKNQIKTRKFESKITSLGLKGQLDIKVDFIFFTDTDCNFYNTNKTIELGCGIDYKCPFFNYSYTKFKNAPGGMVIIGIPIVKIFTFTKYLINRNAIHAEQEKYLAEFNRAFNAQVKPVSRGSNLLLEFLQFSVITGGYIRPI